MAFLRAVRDRFEPDTVVCLGDEADRHSLSYHEHDPDLPAPGDELRYARRFLRALHDLFPSMLIFEALRLKAYRCEAGVLTIGYGRTRGVKPGDKITKEQAEAWLREDLDEAAADVRRALKGAPTTQGQFDAMVLMQMNTGGLANSSILRAHVRGQHDAAEAAFALWNKVTDPATGQKRPSNGLTRRRRSEANLYATGVFVPPDALGQPAAPKPLTQSRTVAGGAVVTAGTVVAQAIEQVQPLHDTLAGLGVDVGWIKIGLAALVVAGAVLAIYARWDDRRRAVR